jgi:putative phosphoesterase
MVRIGILSDTHATIHPGVIKFFDPVDEIWHAGDIGNNLVADELENLKPLKAVTGNIDGQDLRLRYPEQLIFTMEHVKVLLRHMGGYPGKYDPAARKFIEMEKPGLFICGHSHILKVIFDKKNNLLHINPGAAGNSGLHRSITAVRLTIDGANMKDLEVLDIPR